VAAALTIGQRHTARGLVGGYMLKVDARHGVKSLFPASESYFLDRAGNEPLQATSWALVHLFQLQLQSYPLTRARVVLLATRTMSRHQRICV
jgi:hypothetical protein